MCFCGGRCFDFKRTSGDERRPPWFHCVHPAVLYDVDVDASPSPCPSFDGAAGRQRKARGELRLCAPRSSHDAATRQPLWRRAVEHNDHSFSPWSLSPRSLSWPLSGSGWSRRVRQSIKGLPSTSGGSSPTLVSSLQRQLHTLAMSWMMMMRIRCCSRCSSSWWDPLVVHQCCCFPASLSGFCCLFAHHPRSCGDLLTPHPSSIRGVDSTSCRSCTSDDHSPPRRLGRTVIRTMSHGLRVACLVLSTRCLASTGRTARCVKLTACEAPPLQTDSQLDVRHAIRRAPFSLGRPPLVWRTPS